VDLEGQRAHLASATRYFAHQINWLQTDRYALQPAVTQTLADHIIDPATLRAHQRFLLKAEIKVDRTPVVFRAFIPVMPTNSKGVPQ
jgi:hypothetical protein